MGGKGNADMDGDVNGMKPGGLYMSSRYGSDLGRLGRQ